MKPETMKINAAITPQTLARAQARSGDANAIAIASCLGRGKSFDGALATLAELYADQNVRDDAAGRAAAGAGRITVQSGD